MVELPRGNLPPIEFAEKSSIDIESSIITTYEAISGRSLSQSDPVRIFLLSIASIIVQQRSIIDFSAKQNLLSYARGDYIDYVVETLGVERLKPTPAQTTIEFVLSAAQAGVFTIPEGTEITNGQIIFSTNEQLEIPQGQTVGQVTAQCTEDGELGNGLLPGQIKTVVEPIAFVSSAKNITTTQGGADEESDESLVERARLAPASFSVAGPIDAYKYWALTASQSIIDIAVSSPSPGVVDVRPLLIDGEIPGTEILDDVLAVLSADDIRPLTDSVQVNAPTPVTYSVDVEYWIKRSDSSQSVSIQSAVTAAVNDYILWQKTQIGRDITPDELNSRIIQAGAKRVVINSPSFTVLNDTEVAQDTSLILTYQGLENG